MNLTYGIFQIQTEKTVIMILYYTNKIKNLIMCFVQFNTITLEASHEPNITLYGYSFRFSFPHSDIYVQKIYIILTYLYINMVVFLKYEEYLHYSKYLLYLF